MKRTLAIMLALVMVLAMVPALADDPLSGTCGAVGNENNVKWELTQNNNDTAKPTYTLTISGSGAMKNFTANSKNDDRPWKNFISSITKGVVAQGVTNVGDRTFYNCSNMASVELADGITSITGGAFENCTSLTSLALPNSLEKFGGNAFKGCTGLTGELVIPDSVREIKNWAFMNCTSISSVSIGKNVESIFASAFENCTSLEHITFRGKTKTIGLNAFRETSLMSLTLPDGLETIGPNAFYGIETLSGMLVIPESVTEIGEHAFWAGKNAAGNGVSANISGIRVDSSAISISKGAFKATGANYIDLTRVDELSSWGDWVLDENESCIIYAKSNSVLDKVTGSQHVAKNIYALTSGGTFASNTKFSKGTLATPTKEGYDFGGWYENANFSGSAVTNAEAGKTYYAKWTELIGVTVTFDAQGGTVTPVKMFYENGNVNELPTPTRDGYDFVGWFTAAIGGIQVNVGYEIPMFIQTDNDERVPVKEVTLYAQWKAKQPEQQPSGGGYWHPTTTPVPVIVIPPKTGDMTVWQSILHFLGIR